MVLLLCSHTIIIMRERKNFNTEAETPSSFWTPYISYHHQHLLSLLASWCLFHAPVLLTVCKLLFRSHPLIGPIGFPAAVSASRSRQRRGATPLLMLLVGNRFMPEPSHEVNVMVLRSALTLQITSLDATSSKQLVIELTHPWAIIPTIAA